MHKKLEPLPQVAELVLELMPDATLEEQIEATQNLRAYLAAVYRIFCRLQSEGTFESTLAEAKRKEEEFRKKYEEG